MTIADGGIGGAHPYLAGTMPSHIGATIQGSTWAAGVANDIGSPAFLATQDGDTLASWVE